MVPISLLPSRSNRFENKVERQPRRRILGRAIDEVYVYLVETTNALGRDIIFGLGDLETYSPS